MEKRKKRSAAPKTRTVVKTQTKKIYVKASAPQLSPSVKKILFWPSPVLASDRLAVLLCCRSSRIVCRPWQLTAALPLSVAC